MGKKVELTGKRFGRLEVVEEDSPVPKNRMWLCRCECGNEVSVRTGDLSSGKTISCGCAQKEISSKRMTRHGKSQTGLYKVWSGMKGRCLNPKNDDYENYGARGITVCKEWKNSYMDFHSWAEANGYEEGLTIERKNVNGDYEPSNCCWITREEQVKNTRRSILITIEGKTKTLKEWCQLLNLNYEVVQKRYSRHGIRGEELLNQ